MVGSATASAGPLPALFYFALNGKDSLHLDPYNQPIQALETYPIRCFSWDLPFHAQEIDPNASLLEWDATLAQGIDFITPFIEESVQKIENLIEQGLVDRHRICLAGLSRGGFIALHLARKLPTVKCVFAFAPLTNLLSFQSASTFPAHIFKSLQLYEHLDELLAKKIRLYIGNLDERVQTDYAYDFIRTLTKKAHLEKKRHYEYELFITPSIGHKGHGTAKEIFTQGALWGYKQVTK
jgi:esterase FrsA